MALQRKMIRLIMLLVLAAPEVQAQSGNTNFANENLKAVQAGNVMMGIDNRYKGVKGSPFLEEELQEYNVHLQSDRSATVKAKMDLLNNDLYFEGVGGKFFLLKLDRVDSLVNTQTHQKYVNLVLDDLGGIFRVIYEGEKCSLYERFTKQMLKADYKGAYSAGQESDMIMSDNYYCIVINGELEKTDIKKAKRFVRAFPEKQSELRRFIDENEMDTRSEIDLVAIMHYYNSIL